MKINITLALVAFCFFAAAFSCSNESSLTGKKKPLAAKIDATDITISEFSRRWRQISSQGDPESLPLQQRKTLKKQLLERMIDETLLLNKAKSLKIEATPGEIGLTIDEMKGGYNHKTQFNEEMGKAFITPAGLRERVKKYTTMNKLLLQDVHKRLVVTEKEISEYYKKHEKDFEIPEQVEARLITVSTEEEAEIVYEKLKKKAPFTELAREYSISPEAERDGYLGKFHRGVMPPAFDEVCFNLMPKKFSKPVSSDFGFHIFYLIDKFPKKKQTLEEVRDKIEKTLLHKQAAKAEKKYIKSLKNKAKIERYIENLNDIK